jgi:uncharacterized repeat protein (TIGR03803 family)
MNNALDARQTALRTAAAILMTLAAVAPIFAQGGHFKFIGGFDLVNGNEPSSPLVQGPDGNLYGTSSYGGSNSDCNAPENWYCGTIFRTTPDGEVTLLYQFCSQPQCTDGAQPTGLLLGDDGNFYGVTTAGYYPGTVFKITPAGELTTVARFYQQATPSGGLVQGRDGDLYGTTIDGGQGKCYYSTCGTVFRVSRDGTLTTLHEFRGPDGANPNGLTLASDGNFYGATAWGGEINNPLCDPVGCGTVFEITPEGKLTTIIRFLQLNGPGSPPIEGVDGDLYGTTTGGGWDNYGVVYRLTPGGKLTVLHKFCTENDCDDGTNPAAPLIQASDGNFYGTASGLNEEGVGTPSVFRMTPKGDLTPLMDLYLQGATQGLVQYTDGTVYGTTPNGGNALCTYGCGTIFTVSLGLKGFVEAAPAFGMIGEHVSILGSSLIGTTSVTFNGIAAAFNVKSHSEITATIPAGATTGPIVVVTPNGTLTSNVKFKVLP